MRILLSLMLLTVACGGPEDPKVPMSTCESWETPLPIKVETRQEACLCPSGDGTCHDYEKVTSNCCKEPDGSEGCNKVIKTEPVSPCQ